MDRKGAKRSVFSSTKLYKIDWSASYVSTTTEVSVMPFCWAKRIINGYLHKRKTEGTHSNLPKGVAQHISKRKWRANELNTKSKQAYDATRKEGRWKSFRPWDGTLLSLALRPWTSFIGKRRVKRTEARWRANLKSYKKPHFPCQQNSSST